MKDKIIPILNPKCVFSNKYIPEQVADHAEASLSSSARILACPGYLWNSRNAPASVDSAASTDGTEFHALIEEAVKLDEVGDGRYDASWQERFINNIKDDQKKAGVIAWCKIEQNIRKKKLVKGKCFTRLLEKKVYLSDRIFGTLDYALIYEMECGNYGIVIMDAKWGIWEVPAKGNKQLLSYMIALRNHLPEDVREKVKEFYICIFQPKTGETNLDTWKFPVSELYSHSNSFLEAAELALQLKDRGDKLTFEEARQHLRAGDHCKFCPVEGVCEVQTEYISESIGEDFEEFVDNLVEGKDTLYSDEKISKLLNVKKTIIDKLESLVKYSTASLLEGKTIPGWKLNEGGSVRKFVEPDPKVLAKQLKKLGVKQPFKDPEIKGLTAIEAEIGKGKLGDLVYKPQGKPKLVKESAGGKPWNKDVAAADDFSVIEE